MIESSICPMNRHSMTMPTMNLSRLLGRLWKMAHLNELQCYGWHHGFRQCNSMGGIGCSFLEHKNGFFNE